MNHIEFVHVGRNLGTGELSEGWIHTQANKGCGKLEEKKQNYVKESWADLLSPGEKTVL